MEHSEICEEVPVSERCIDCIDEYVDGKAQAAEDLYREVEL